MKTILTLLAALVLTVLIRAALVTFSITVDDEWDGEIRVEY